MRRLAVISVLFSVLLAHAQQAQVKDDPALLTLDRIFASGEFRAQSYGPVRWLARQGAYALTESSIQVKGASDIVRVDPATGKQEVLVSAAHLVPRGDSRPLTIEEFQISADESRMMIYTNSHRVWRKNTRGDYWVFDINGHDLHKLGGTAKAATLMFATFSPDSTKAAYVLNRNLYVEDLATHKVNQLTTNDSPHVINGTFDWVYEEEFGLHQGYHWSPDSKSIAFWQLDTEGVDDYYLVNNTAGLYQQLTKFKYPKVGRPNAACSLGVVRLDEPGLVKLAISRRPTRSLHPVDGLGRQQLRDSPPTAQSPAEHQYRVHGKSCGKC